LFKKSLPEKRIFLQFDKLIYFHSWFNRVDPGVKIQLFRYQYLNDQFLSMVYDYL